MATSFQTDSWNFFNQKSYVLQRLIFPPYFRGRYVNECLEMAAQGCQFLGFSAPFFKNAVQNLHKIEEISSELVDRPQASETVLIFLLPNSALRWGFAGSGADIMEWKRVHAFLEQLASSSPTEADFVAMDWLSPYHSIPLRNNLNKSKGSKNQQNWTPGNKVVCMFEFRCKLLWLTSSKVLLRPNFRNSSLHPDFAHKMKDVASRLCI